MKPFTNLECNFDDKIELIADGYSFTFEGIVNRDLKNLVGSNYFINISEINQQYYFTYEKNYTFCFFEYPFIYFTFPMYK